MSAQAETAPRPVRVAIADDSDDLCMMLAELVNSSAGLQCVARITAQRDLVAAVAASDPDVLLLDLNFGGVSSLPLVPQLRAAHGKTRIVIHSGFDIDPLATRALDGGAVAVIPKGGDPDELIAAIRRIALG
ncbi:MAG TPA: response regulator transcription factor [Steroidobacteraceae bacterium]|nr:response regulator transcription factor [Steroidobacteraceae bacterium]